MLIVLSIFRLRRRCGRILNLALKLTAKFCSFFTYLTYVTGQFFPNICGHDNLRWLDCFQIWSGCSLGTSDDLINFWEESIRNKMAAAAIEKKKFGGGNLFSFF